MIRDERDVVVCEDPERPGRRKAIPARQLSSLGGGNGGGGNGLSEGVGIGRENDRRAATDDDGEDARGGRNESEHDKGGGSKKEIPVPTITTVRRYDRDVPPDFDVPGSYVRHIRPTYEEATRCAVEYNVDADDERWWAENADFGPRARVKIIVAAPPPAAAAMGRQEEDQEEDDDDVDESDDVRMAAPDATVSRRGPFSRCEFLSSLLWCNSSALVALCDSAPLANRSGWRCRKKSRVGRSASRRWKMRWHG